MSTSSLNLEALFGDLDLDFEPALPEAKPSESLPGAFAYEAEALLDLVGFSSASSLLSDSDAASRPTRPYDIPADELSRTVTMWGDDERFSTLSTTPISVDELPADAYPTEVNVFGAD